eukprot:TRINITY_DN1633_c0_g1_i1.p7 TRINITY_DN1633_c0_g1~~TRINITY_DN1633_c0_g1_i1.p7  ORF type:complete len:114 (-),score=18.03 TRINITY_DN1633_c0_g1_i1:171-512(-)
MTYEKRTEWDQSIIRQEEVREIYSKLRVIYYAMKAPLIFMQARDFVEKRILFVEEGTYYIYASSVPNEEYEEKENYVRCDKIFECTMLRKEDGRLVLHSVSQADYKVNCLQNR